MNRIEILNTSIKMKCGEIKRIKEIMEEQKEKSEKNSVAKTEYGIYV